MIIGNGDVASVLQDRDDLIYFASGVSNSQETRGSEFRREKDLLFEQIDKQKRLCTSVHFQYSMPIPLTPATSGRWSST